jgi:replicative DNA helicase Mcm
MTVERPELIDVFVELYRNYYRDELGKLAQGYPKDKQSLTIEAKDLFRKDPDLLKDWIEHPDQMQEYAEEALGVTELPVDQSLEGASVHLTDTNDYIDRQGVGELTEADLGTYVALECQLSLVSERKPRLKKGGFECRQCGTITEILQPFMDTSEPHECGGCGTQGPFTINEQRSEWVDQRKVKLQAPPEQESDGEILGYCLADMADPEGSNLIEQAGSRVTVFGKLEADMSSLFGRGQNEPVPDEYFIPESFEFGRKQQSEIDVEQHRKTVKEWTDKVDAIDIFKRNIDPSLVVTEQWENALEMATVYLFGAPRIDPPGGDTIRGDLHMLFVSDPGMNKSAFSEKLAELSPMSVKKDSEGMSSSVALTAAATREGFGDDSWTIEPGALPKANGGHLILDEIDKGPDGFLNGIHSPLEGTQTLHVEKAGKETTLSTRCSFLALGNPVDGRLDTKHEPLNEQVDLHPALMSRFDLICAMSDSPDSDVDREVATGVLDSIDESARIEYGDLDLDEAENVSGSVERDVMKAWVKIAREEVQPMMTDSAKETLADFYVDTRQLNGESTDTPPVTARTLPAGWRIAAAYARVEHSETIEQEHAERAVNLSKQIVGDNNLDPETGLFDANRTTETPSTQQERVDAIKTVMSNGEDMTLEEIAEKSNIPKSKIEHRLEKMRQKNPAPVMKPENDTYRWIA